MELRRRDGRPLRVGHKGAAALAPENTLEALEAALALGVDAVEVDVVPLGDGTLVLAHSDDLHELSHGAVTGRIGDRSLAELRRDAPRLPTLDEALAFLAARAPGTGIQLDMKWYGYEARVAAALREHGLVGRTLVSSFFAKSLQELRRLEPEVRVGLTYPYDRYGVSARRALAPAALLGLLALRRALPRRIGPMLERAGASVATLHHLVVTAAAVERCHHHGAAVWAWTVDDRGALARLERMGVDAVITNDPRIFDPAARLEAP